MSNRPIITDPRQSPGYSGLTDDARLTREALARQAGVQVQLTVKASSTAHKAHKIGRKPSGVSVVTATGPVDAVWADKVFVYVRNSGASSIKVTVEAKP